MYAIYMYVYIHSNILWRPHRNHMVMCFCAFATPGPSHVTERQDPNKSRNARTLASHGTPGPSQVTVCQDPRKSLNPKKSDVMKSLQLILIIK